MAVTPRLYSTTRHSILNLPDRASARIINRMTRRFLGSQSFKGRGALSNPAVRFDSTSVEKTTDGWQDEEIPTAVQEVVLPDRAKSVITSNNSPDVGFEQSINPYR